MANNYAESHNAEDTITKKRANASPSILAVIPTYNGSRYLSQALSSLLRQSYHPLEILVVDDCSTEDIVIPDQIKGKYVLIRNPVNLGLAGTLNKVLQMADSYQYIFIMQDDVELLDSNYLQKVLERFDDSRVAVVSGRAIVNDRLSLPKRAFAKFSYLDFAPQGLTAVSYSILKADLISVPYLKNIGGFSYSGDRRLGLEDQTLGFRLGNKGYTILIDPSVAYSVNFARDETLLSLLRKESLYGRTLGNAVTRNEISLTAKSEWDDLRINHRKAQMIITGFTIFAAAFGTTLFTPLPFLLPIVGSLVFNMCRIHTKKRIERIVFSMIAFLADLVFGFSFMYGVVKNLVRMKREDL